MSNQKITKLTIHFTDESGEAKVVSYEFPSAVGIENTPTAYLAIKQFFDANFNEVSDGE